ncbi:MAG: hypothetical protein HZC37_31555 [Burkholderiales bacterium]|nr:hypothetical protein [Burkholderiales bacterium]
MEILSEEEVQAVTGAGFILTERAAESLDGFILTEGAPVSTDGFILTE